jgi:aspartyl-tRNA(Asn)/glutamyl-tRNA(Gln) amidotransferase subunit C
MAMPPSLRHVGAVAGRVARRYECSAIAPGLSGKGYAMQVDAATVRRIARLARIKVTDAEAAALEKELSGILDWVKQLDEVDTAKVEPMTRVIPMTLKQRPDVVTDGGIADDVLANAPARENHFFVVPKVVE